MIPKNLPTVSPPWPIQAASTTTRRLKLFEKNYVLTITMRARFLGKWAEFCMMEGSRESFLLMSLHVLVIPNVLIIPGM